jgi:hypothetical protein
MEWGEKNKSWRCGGPHKKKDYLNPLHGITLVEISQNVTTPFTTTCDL